MNQEYIWGLAGILLGWVLTTVTALFGVRRGRLQALGLLLTKLIRVHRQVRHLQSTLESMKDHVDDWQEFERIRKGMMDRHFLEPEDVRSDLKEAIDAVSGMFPLLAIDLEETIEMLLKNKSASMASASESRELYTRMLTTYEVGLQVIDTQLQKNIRSLASSHGLGTRLSYEIAEYRRRKTGERNREFRDKWIGEMHAAMKAAATRHQEPEK